MPPPVLLKEIDGLTGQEGSLVPLGTPVQSGAYDTTAEHETPGGLFEHLVQGSHCDRIEQGPNRVQT
jgi:hypothetical protein